MKWNEVALRNRYDRMLIGLANDVAAVAAVDASFSLSLFLSSSLCLSLLLTPDGGYARRHHCHSHELVRRIGP